MTTHKHAISTRQRAGMATSIYIYIYIYIYKNKCSFKWIGLTRIPVNRKGVFFIIDIIRKQGFYDKILKLFSKIL
jgi:hypothetical protein